MCSLDVRGTFKWTWRNDSACYQQKVTLFSAYWDKAMVLVSNLTSYKRLTRNVLHCYLLLVRTFTLVIKILSSIPSYDNISCIITPSFCSPKASVSFEWTYDMWMWMEVSTEANIVKGWQRVNSQFEQFNQINTIGTFSLQIFTCSVVSGRSHIGYRENLCMSVTRENVAFLPGRLSWAVSDHTDPVRPIYMKLELWTLIFNLLLISTQSRITSTIYVRVNKNVDEKHAIISVMEIGVGSPVPEGSYLPSLAKSCENMASNSEQIMEKSRNSQIVYVGHTDLSKHCKTDHARGIMKLGISQWPHSPIASSGNDQLCLESAAPMG